MIRKALDSVLKHIKEKPYLIVAFVIAAFFAGGLAALLVDIHGKQISARNYPLMYLKVSDDDVNPEVWGKNFPSQYRTYLEMKDSSEPTPFGGSMAYSKLIRYPQLTALWAGYAFAADFNEERSHYYSQVDQVETKRNNKAWLNANGFPKFKGQPGACMNCHSGWTPKMVREMGWLEFNGTPYVDIVKKLVDTMGNGIFQARMGSTCADCHSPRDMSLRVTRQAYINAMVKRGYQADTEQGIKASRREMRSHVCQQCHVEYYFKKKTNELTFPWSLWPKDAPLRIEMIDGFYDAASTGENAFKADWTHKLTGAFMIKLQHPETELFSSGVHARSGVSCADCHMTYEREGAYKITSHNIRSPLLTINGSCMTCHPITEKQLRDRILTIQKSTANSMRLTEGAILALIDDIGRAKALILGKYAISPSTSLEVQEKVLAGPLEKARDMHRRASLRWDFIFSENSTGFHSPQEAARVLAQAVDFARRGQLEVQVSLKGLGLTLQPVTGAGKMPPRPARIPGTDPKVGMEPPAELVTIDREPFM